MIPVNLLKIRNKKLSYSNKYILFSYSRSKNPTSYWEYGFRSLERYGKLLTFVIFKCRDLHIVGSISGLISTSSKYFRRK